jgi:hypothetical protein
MKQVLRKWSERAGVGALALIPVAAMATPTFESTVFDALTTKVGNVTTEAGPYIALILGVYLVYKMVRRFT